MADELAAARAELLRLQNAKDAIEAEVEAILSRLNSGPSAPGVSGNLVDKEGFPRADIDITAVRLDRQRFNCLINDHKAVMKQLDEGLKRLHAATKPLAAPQGAGGSSHALAPLLHHVPQLHGGIAVPAGPTAAHARPTPFAEIDELSPGSPAEAAGLLVGDLMCSFGGVQHTHGTSPATGSGSELLPAVARVLAQSEGKDVPAVVLRAGAVVNVVLTPKQWGGRGLLGCHLRPL